MIIGEILTHASLWTAILMILHEAVIFATDTSRWLGTTVRIAVLVVRQIPDMILQRKFSS